MTDVLGYAYGLTVFTGGAIGYIKGTFSQKLSPEGKKKITTPTEYELK
jgi:hypothetical protein